MDDTCCQSAGSYDCEESLEALAVAKGSATSSKITESKTGPTNISGLRFVF